MDLPDYGINLPELEPDHDYIGVSEPEGKRGSAWIAHIYPHSDGDYFHTRVDDMRKGEYSHSRYAIHKDALSLQLHGLGIPEGTQLKWVKGKAEGKEYSPYNPEHQEKFPQQVYFIQAKDSACVKIGVAKFPEYRLRELQVGNHEELFLLYSYPCKKGDENRLHKRFAHLHRRGEWFSLNEEIMLFIEELKRG